MVSINLINDIFPLLKTTSSLDASRFSAKTFANAVT